MKSLEIYYFNTTSGRNPIKEFVFNQNEQTREKIFDAVRQLEKYGFHLPKTVLRRISGTPDLWELRIKTLSGIYRVFLAKLGKRMVIVLLHIIQKKTQKTPKRDIKTALKRLQILKRQGAIWEK